MADGSKIIDLRNLLAERFPQSFTPRATRLITGVSRLDEAAGGGLPKGAITELTTAGPSAGSATLIGALLSAAHRDRYFLALIDGCDSFDPQTHESEQLRHLLWVRCHHALEAVKAVDLLLRDGNFPAVVLDLVLNRREELRKIPQTSWYRLQRLVEPTSTALFVLTRQSLIASAQIKFVLANHWTLGDLEHAQSVDRLHVRTQRVHGGRYQLAESG